MKTRSLIIIALLAILAASCIPSLFPLYTRDDLVCDDRIEGNWSQGDNLWTIEKPEHHSSCKNSEGNEPEKDSEPEDIHYRLRVMEWEEGDTAEAWFLVHLLELDEQRYVNFYPEDYELHHEFLSWHMIETNNFAKISISDSSFKLTFFDPEYVRKLIEENRIRIAHVWLDDLLLLTAPTRDLQKFVIKYADKEDALQDWDPFRRI